MATELNMFIVWVGFHVITVGVVGADVRIDHYRGRLLRQ